MDTHARTRAGVVMGVAAVALWGMSAACTVWVGRQISGWQFLSLACAVAGLFQTVCLLMTGRRLRAILLPPPRLWVAIILGFVLYQFLYVMALVHAASDAQAAGVNLLNYLWPALAVLFTIGLVPGHRLHGRLALAVVLSLAGVLVVTGRDMVWRSAGVAVWPYLLGVAAAVSWALYCALLSRWRQWARGHAVSPAGFLIVSLLATAVCLLRGEWTPLSLGAWSGVLLTAFGPCGGAYLLWEMALHRVPGTTLGLLGAATPVLSMLGLMALFALTGRASPDAGRYVLLLGASLLIAAGVVLGRE